MNNRTGTKIRVWAEVGEEIPFQQAAKMVKDFQDTYPQAEKVNFIGRDILQAILAQPDCTGIRFYNGLNELNQNTLVYVGTDSNGQMITQYATVDPDGKVHMRPGIVADRSCPGEGHPHDHPDLDWSKPFG